MRKAFGLQLVHFLDLFLVRSLQQVEKLASQAKEWCEPPVIPALKLPGPNPFVPRDLSVIKPKGRVVKPGEKLEAPSVVLVFPTTAGWKVRNLRVACCAAF